ncbi:hypothetical protein BV898_10816 [Hypsibius exemplaris]|uniref:Uncharacterized protein n=1 Tax=Hypsibius exemplaris TaxID=2072580 RepID=A0A1W0WIR2_HYPEX|nr:hypothetical protein BV898_10816 [Hypsibius exemplaris]
MATVLSAVGFMTWPCLIFCLLVSSPLFLKPSSACCSLDGKVCGGRLGRRCFERLDYDLDSNPNILYTCQKNVEPVLLRKCPAECQQDPDDSDNDFCAPGMTGEGVTTSTTVKRGATNRRTTSRSIFPTTKRKTAATANGRSRPTTSEPPLRIDIFWPDLEVLQEPPDGFDLIDLKSVSSDEPWPLNVLTYPFCVDGVVLKSEPGRRSVICVTHTTKLSANVIVTRGTKCDMEFCTLEGQKEEAATLVQRVREASSRTAQLVQGMNPECLNFRNQELFSHCIRCITTPDVTRVTENNVQYLATTMRVSDGEESCEDRNWDYGIILTTATNPNCFVIREFASGLVCGICFKGSGGARAASETQTINLHLSNCLISPPHAG